MCVCACLYVCDESKRRLWGEKKVSWIKKGVGGTKGKAAEG